jgi:hypothetical protein
MVRLRLRASRQAFITASFRYSGKSVWPDRRGRRRAISATHSPNDVARARYRLPSRGLPFGYRRRSSSVHQVMTNARRRHAWPRSWCLPASRTAIPASAADQYIDNGVHHVSAAEVYWSTPISGSFGPAGILYSSPSKSTTSAKFGLARPKFELVEIALPEVEGDKRREQHRASRRARREHIACYRSSARLRL